MSPRNATTDKQSGSRYYHWRGQNYYSVTTIIDGGIPKQALIRWAAKMVAEGAVEHLDQVVEMCGKGDDGRDAAVAMLKSLPWNKKERAADLGSTLHAAVEAYALHKPFPEWPVVIRPRMAAFEQWLADYQPTYLASEASVFSRSQRYAGTLDGIVKIGRRKLLIDAKSGKGIYPEVALQLAAYRYAEFIGVPDGSEKKMPKVDGCAVLHLSDDGYEFREVLADESIYAAFLYCREVFRFARETSKSVFLGPVRRPRPGKAGRAEEQLAKKLAQPLQEVQI